MNAKISEFVIWRPSNLQTFCVFFIHFFFFFFFLKNLQQIIYIETSLTLLAIFQEIDEQLETKCAR